jgi:iron(III) transport system substrate-binding protein
MDFLISDECQKIVASLTNRPVNTKIPNTNKFLLPFSQIKIAYEDIAYTSDNKKAIQQRWSDLWAKLN